MQRGFVRELRITVPYLQLSSEPIKVLIDTVELVIASTTQAAAETATAAPAATATKTASTHEEAEATSKAATGEQLTWAT